MNAVLRARLTNYVFFCLDVFVISYAFILENAQVFFRTRQFPDVTLFSGYGWATIPGTLWIFLFMGILIRHHLLQGALIQAWRRNWALIGFLGFAVISLAWSVFFPATLYKLALLFFSTIVGSYLGIRFGAKGIIELLTWIAILCTLFSFSLILLTPFGTMWNVPFVGSWNGMFWHRNHAGSLFAFFNSLFLARLTLEAGLPKKHMVVFILMYLLTIIHVFGSRSAAGIIVFLVLNSALLIGLAWMKWYSKLRRWHYYAIALLAVFGFVGILLNLELFFGLLGRTPTMTGRTPLWRDLFLNFYLQKPIFGYGYGALWMQESFRVLMQTRHNWLYPVYFADNGFFDILLNVGLIGFTLFMITYVQAWVRGLKRLVSTKNRIDLFPVLTLLYVLVGNLSYSFLLEVDQFVWMILVITVFVITPLRPRAEIPG